MLQSVVKDGPKGSPSGYMSSPLVGQSSTTPTPCCSSQRLVDCCRVTRSLVLLEFPPLLLVSKPPLRGRQQRVLQNILVTLCVESVFIECQLSLAPRAESSPRIHRQPPPVHLLPRNRFGQTKLCRGLSPLNCLNVFIAQHHIAPVLPYVGLSELQPTALMSFRQSRGFPLFKCTQISTVHCSLDCLVTHIGDLLSIYSS